MELGSLQPVCYGVATTIFAIAVTSTLLRIYARIFIVKSFGLDDWTMASIFFFNIGQQTFLYLFLLRGGGLHATAVKPADLEILPTMLFAEEIYYIFIHFIIKQCFLFFYLRLSPVQTFVRFVYGTMVINALAAVGIWLLYCLQCFPLDAFMHPALHPNAKCVEVLITYFVPASINISTDLLILVLPITTLWNLQVSLKRRLGLMVVFGFGASSVLISILRLLVLHEFYANPDFTWVLGKMIIVSALEIEVAIIAANVPSLKTIWVTHMRNGSLSNSGGSGSHALSNMGNSASASRARSRLKQDHLAGKSTSGTATNVSEEHLFDIENGIKVTSEVGMAWSETETTNSKQRLHETYHRFMEL